MASIIKRELGAYFTSPIGFVFLGAFYLMAGFYFFATVLLTNAADISGVLGSMATICIFLIPILTMRLYSEERKNRTDQLLLTSPVPLASLVLAKFLAAFLMLTAAVAVILLQIVVMVLLSGTGWALPLSGLLGLLLMGGALIAVCAFVSSLTENQVIAAVGSFAASLFLILIDSLSTSVSSTAVAGILEKLSFYRRVQDFLLGLPGLSDMVFFISITALFLFLTARVLEKRRWS